MQIIPLKGTTTGKDVLEAVLTCFKDNNLHLSRLVSVTTDGAPAMIGVKKGFVTLLENHMASVGFDNTIIKLHCIIHQEALCAKHCQINNVMTVVVKIVNYILSRGLNHRLFKKLCQESDSSDSDLIYHCDVRWLSRGNMLQRFLNLLPEICTFLEMKQQDFPQLSDPHWISNLAFLVDITQYLNDLNKKLQGKNQLVNVLYANIEAFEMKLVLLENQIANLDFTNFPELKKFPPSGIAVPMAFLIELREQFCARFTDTRAYKKCFKLFGAPFSMAVNEAPKSVQMELIDLQVNDLLKAKFDNLMQKTYQKNNVLIEFYQGLLQSDVACPNLLDHAKKRWLVCLAVHMFVKSFFPK